MTTSLALPPEQEMYRALVERDGQYEGVFVVGVRTTGIFCRPTCPARKPLRKNVDFYRSARDALAAGFRPCRRCRPLDVMDATPDWLGPLLVRVEVEPRRRWTDADLRAAEVDPVRVRRWFQRHHGITFHTYLRTRRLAMAIGQIKTGADVTSAAMDSGYESLSGFRDALRNWLGDVPTVAKHREPMIVNRILTPLGPMIAAASDAGLCLLEFADRRMLPAQFRRIARIFEQPIAPGEHPLIQQTQREIAEYFNGRRTRFDLPLRCDGTPFQVSVWQELMKIPFGQTSSYETIARSIGRPGAQRAVGGANGDNRFAIIIPCHRVVRSDGSLCGYGGGLWRKKRLLEHEQTVCCHVAELAKVQRQF